MPHSSALRQRRHLPAIERLEARQCRAGMEPNACPALIDMAADPDAAAASDPSFASRHEAAVNAVAGVRAEAVVRAGPEVEPQFRVHQPPRVQLGNAPLVGTPAFRDADQIELIWQTQPAGAGTQDSFLVEYREVGQRDWAAAVESQSVATDVEGRWMHSAVIQALAWDTRYEYRVSHLRAGSLVVSYEQTFQTRLSPGDPQPFAFAAYGDSAWPQYIEQFRGVQQRINEQQLDFAMLLGDNIYPHGTHADADGRFDPQLNPEATQWNRSHIDYLAVGNHDREQPWVSQQLFAVPVPQAGINAHVDLPPNEFEEFFYSFDYGLAHFTVIDTWMTNLVESDEIQQRIDAALDFAVRDLQQSTATWKIVVAHNPFIGTDKSRHPDEHYFRTLVRELNRVGVDLVMSGDSHTYAWTYPIAGYDDANHDDHLEYDEIEFTVDPDNVFDKDLGLVQLVAGVGGRDFRLGDYTEPVYSRGYSLRGFTVPVEFGFARVEVTQREMVVTYISAATGGIVGDLNHNGREDADEPFFGQFRLVDESIPSGDFDLNGALNVEDLDRMCAAVRDPNAPPTMDLDRDGRITSQDVARLLHNYFGTGPGDANLDGIFNSSDLVRAFQAGAYERQEFDEVSWSQGDWNCDGRFTTQDLVLSFQANRYLRV